MGKQNTFIQKATKNATRNHDAKKLDLIQTFLLKMGIPTIREKTIHNEKFTQKYHERTPDLTCSVNGMILEHDTVKVHGELGYENKKTLERNSDFERVRMSFGVINEDLCKMLGIDESKLAVYLYYHEKMKQNAINNCIVYPANFEKIPDLEQQ